MAFIMLVFRYSVAVSISVFVFSEIEAAVERLKISLKSYQLVSWLWIRPLSGLEGIVACGLKVFFLEWWKLVVLNAGFDDDSGAAVCLSTRVLGVVEVLAVYFELVFVGEVDVGYEHYVDLLLF